MNFKFFRSVIFFVSAVLNSKCYGGIKVCKSLNETIKHEKLSREKRFLVYPPSTAGSVLKLATSYLGPIVSWVKKLFLNYSEIELAFFKDIPLWQTINCFRSFQYQYGLPDHWVRINQGRIQREFWGWNKFFQFGLWFFKKKIPTPPL